MEKVKVNDDNRRWVWKELLRWGYVDKAYSSYSTEKERTFFCSEVYACCCPESSWEKLVSVLYGRDEMSAVDQARPFLPPRGEFAKYHLRCV